ncbi:unnamed protein product [Tenebrio molitor]|nr:unnamed protein product [Tenebrio molitor]
MSQSEHCPELVWCKISVSSLDDVDHPEKTTRAPTLREPVICINFNKTS